MLQPDSIADFSLWFGGGSQAAQGNTTTQHPNSVMFSIAVVYGLFLVIQLVRLLWGLLQVRSLLNRATECSDVRVHRLSERFLHKANSTNVRVLTSLAARVPFAVGFLRPAIILPVSLVQQAKDDELAVVLAHEFAHIQRRDWIWNLVLLLASLPVSFHPCIALMRRKVEAAREAACDEFAAGCMASASTYARALLDLAGKLAQPQPSLAAAYKGAALGVLDGSTLGDRIRRLMDRSPRLGTKQTHILFGAAICTLLIACLAVTNFALASPSGSTSGSITGVWTGKLTDRNPRVEGATVGHSQAYLKLEQRGSQITGVIGADAEHNAPIEKAALQGDHLRFQTTMQHGDEITHWTADMVVNGDQMSGTGRALRSDQHSWEVEINLTRQK
jgi:beta-lactamase regulating signal transducer with metallopeptidase domain